MEIVNSSKEYNSDGTYIYSCQYHVIFTTKYRRKVLTEIISNKLKELILEKQEAYNYQIIEMEIMEDHVHLLIDVNPKKGVYNIVNILN